MRVRGSRAQWDISTATKTSHILEASATYTGHTAVVEDVAFHMHHAHLFGSVGDDAKLMIWDKRDAKYDKAKHVVDAPVELEQRRVLVRRADELRVLKVPVVPEPGEQTAVHKHLASEEAGDQGPAPRLPPLTRMGAAARAPRPASAR